MIKRFSSLFAGHIDLGDMGQDATPANDRRYSDAQLATICLLYTSDAADE